MNSGRWLICLRWWRLDEQRKVMLVGFDGWRSIASGVFFWVPTSNGMSQLLALSSFFLRNFIESAIRCHSLDYQLLLPMPSPPCQMRGSASYSTQLANSVLVTVFAALSSCERVVRYDCLGVLAHEAYGGGHTNFS